MWMKTTSSRDNWERLVAAVIKRDQIRQLCHQDSITTVDSEFSDLTLSLESVSTVPSPQLLLARNSTVEEDYFGVERFSLRELQVATDNFSDRNIIGRGGLSKVYTGKLGDGSLVTVKKYKEAAVCQVRIREELEISSIAGAHRNVIGLRGFCVTEKERLLVYPYMKNGSVVQHLGAREESITPLNWAMKQRIAVGVARGMAHLHNGCMRPIIHRDIKAANILLDDDFEPLVSGFSLATFADCDQDDFTGTFGYVFPEYHSTLKCSLKSDIYDYGIFLLGLITGRPIFDLAWLAYHDYMELLDWVKHLLEEKKLKRMIDQGEDEKEVEKFVQIALICTQTYPDRRPTMSEVVMMLEDGVGLTQNWEAFSSNI